MSDESDRKEDLGMAKVTVSCEGCEGVQTTNYSGWKLHLLEEGHQERAREHVKTMTVKVKKRTVVVFGVRGVTPKHILRHFGNISFVTNIVFWGEREDFCVITFLNSRFRDEVLKTSHIVKKMQVYLRPLDDIPEIEWISICPFAAPEAKDGIVKMELDDENGNRSPDDYSEETSDEGLSDIEAGATVASFRSSGYKGNREKSEGTSTTPTANDGKILPATVTVLDPVYPSPVPEQSNGNDPLTFPVPRSEPETGAVIEIAKSGQVISNTGNTIDIDDNDDHEPNIFTLEHQLFVQSATEIMGNDTMNMIPDIGRNNRKEFLNSIMEDFYNANLMPETEWEVRQYVASHLQLMLQGLYPNCLLIQYGIIGSTAECGHEAPLFYLDANGATGDRNPINQHDMNFPGVLKRQKLTEIAKYFEVYFLNHVATLKVNLREQLTVQYTNTTTAHGQMDMKCGIRITGFLSVQSNRLVNFLLKLDNRVRPLMIIIQHWANHHNFVKSKSSKGNKNEKASDCFPPTLIQWVVIFFLIHKKILPTINSFQALRDNHTRAPLIFQGEDISFCDDAKAMGWVKKNDYDKNPDTQNPSAICVLELAHELFRAFGDEEYIRNSIISPNLGEYISKEDLRSNGSVLQGFEAFEKAIKFLDPKFNNQFIVQHPLKLGINMASDVSPNVFQRFQEQCRFTADCLFRLPNSEKEMQNPISLLTLPVSQNAPPASATATPISENDQPSGNIFHPRDQHLSMKREGFKIHLRIRQKNALLQQNRIEKWLDLFEDFNNTIWPVCFGVNLFELESTLDAPQRAETSFLSAFKGVVTNSDLLASWAYEKQTPVDMFKLTTTLYSTLAAEVRKKREIEKPSTTPPNETMEELFSFDCQVVGCGWNLKTDNPNATCGTIELFISNVRSQDARYIEGGGGKIFRENLKSAYASLWQRHVQKVFGKRKREKPAEGGTLRITSREFIADSGSD